jgi:hypothetical protein
VVAAVGAGVLALITGAVIALPHWLNTAFRDSGAVLTAVNPEENPQGLLVGPVGEDLASSSQCLLGMNSYFVPEHLGLVGPFSDQALGPWLKTHDATSAGETSFSFVLQGARDGTTIVITGLHTVLVSRTPAPAGTVVNLSTDGCGAGVLYKASIDLDARNPKPDIAVLRDDGTAVHQSTLQYAVSSQDVAAVSVNASTSRFDVQWKLRIDYTVNGRVGQIFLPHGGGSFHTTAVAGDPVLNLNHDVNAPPSDAWTMGPPPPQRPPAVGSG